MKINIGIVGYGNLGKATEQIVLANSHLNLVAIFSRRMISSKFNTVIEPYENFKNYVGKIDIMLLCGGSKSDLEVQTPEIAEYFDVINTFDTHSKIPQEWERLNQIASKNGHRVIMSCGWDPGIFSVIRAMFEAVGKTKAVSFWGKGVSMGHSDAIRRVNGVEDGIQFTVPNAEAVKLAKKGSLPANLPLHFRECYVVAQPKNQARVEYDIKSIPGYFKGQPTTVNFVDNLKLLSLKSKLSHKGQIISHFRTVQGTKCKMEFSVAMDSNPNFTASIIVAYISAVINLKADGKTGAFTNLDIPASYLYLGEERANLIKTLC